MPWIPVLAFVAGGYVAWRASDTVDTLVVLAAAAGSAYVTYRVVRS